MSNASATLAGTPGEHCITGVRHFGEPTGTVEKIAGVDTYVSQPPQGQQPKAVVLFYADVWGPLYINNKLLQDYFASQGRFSLSHLELHQLIPVLGFVVVGIDYFEGDPIYLHANEEGFDRPAWFRRMLARSQELEPKWFDAIKERFRA